MPQKSKRAGKWHISRRNRARGVEPCRKRARWAEFVPEECTKHNFLSQLQAPSRNNARTGYYNNNNIIIIFFFFFYFFIFFFFFTVIFFSIIIRNYFCMMMRSKVMLMIMTLLLLFFFFFT